MQSLEEIKARKSALTSTIDSYMKHIDPLKKELKELETKEKELMKAKNNNEKEGIE